MRLIGKRGDYYYYKCEGILPLLLYLPRYEQDHIIAGGAALHLLLKDNLKDIDVWVQDTIPEEATAESQWAYNYKKPQGVNVQYMKIRATTPSKLLDTFDIDACKCAVYNVTLSEYTMCIHRYLQPLVHSAPLKGICGVKQDALNELSQIRFHKYARKLGVSPMDMFSPNDYALAIKHSTHPDRTIEEIEAQIDIFQGDQYELLEHLRELFGDQETEPTMSGFDTIDIARRPGQTTANRRREVVDRFHAFLNDL